MSSPSNNETQKPTKPSFRSIFFGGLLPVILFTVIEDKYGTMYGLYAGLTFGLGELLYEKFRHGQVSKITWIGNSLLVFFGLISLLTQDGLWFKLQPALMEGIAVIFLWGAVLLKKPVIASLMEAQGQSVPEPLRERLQGLTFRLGLFFLVHTALAVWAAFDWSTTAWALLKGVGLTVSFVIYLVAEGLWLRRTLNPHR